MDAPTGSLREEMMAEQQTDGSSGKPGHDGSLSRLHHTLRRHDSTRGNSDRARLYDRYFSRIRIGEQKRVPAFIQVDCRGTTPLAAVRRVYNACARVGTGDLIELITKDFAVVVAALSWCNSTGGRIERMESGPEAFVLDIAAGRVKAS